MVLIVALNFSIDTMIEKLYLDPFFSHVMSIFSKIMQFWNSVMWGSINLNGSGPTSNRSTCSTPPPTCNLFPWKIFNFEISALNISISQYLLTCSNKLSVLAGSWTDFFAVLLQPPRLESAKRLCWWRNWFWDSTTDWAIITKKSWRTNATSKLT